MPVSVKKVLHLQPSRLWMGGLTLASRGLSRLSCVAAIVVALMFAVVLRADEARAGGSPYTLSVAVYKADSSALAQLPGFAPAAGTQPDTPLRPVLAVTLTPASAAQGTYLYGGKSIVSGKPTEIGVFDAAGTPRAAYAWYPPGEEKADPLQAATAAPLSGGTPLTRLYSGPVTFAVPLDSQKEGAALTVHVEALACSSSNCTPLSLIADVTLPDAAHYAALPDASAQPWWAAVLAGLREETLARLSRAESLANTVSPAFAVSGGAGGLPQRGGALPIVPGGDLRPGSGFSPESLMPEPFSPGLEVTSLGKALLLGFLAGIILNFMPCVLPVLGIKLASLLGHEGEGRDGLRRFRRHQVLFALGILTWFAVMALLFRFLELAWGQIFQSPAVVLALAVALLLLALNLFGVLSLPVIDFRAGQSRNPDAQAFLSGVTATLLATPCGGPLLGGVLGWALTQPLGALGVTLASVGLGMASPYLALAAFPALARRLPRPGAWMGVMEQVLGFLLLGTVAYLVTLLPVESLGRVVPALVLAAFGGWLWGKGACMETARRLAFRAIAVACVVTACIWPLTSREAGVRWTPYSSQAIASELGKRMVLVDFTADWCPTCKVVEATALSDSVMRKAVADHGVALFRVDMTRSNPEGEALLKAMGSASIPVIAVFPKGDSAFSPLVLRDVVTAGQVREALEQAASR